MCASGSGVGGEVKDMEEDVEKSGVEDKDCDDDELEGNDFVGNDVNEIDSNGASGSVLLKLLRRNEHLHFSD